MIVVGEVREGTGMRSVEATRGQGAALRAGMIGSGKGC